MKTIINLFSSTTFARQVAGRVGYSGGTDGIGTPSSVTTDGTFLYVIDHNATRRIALQTGEVSKISDSTGAGIVYLNGSLFITGNHVIKRLDSGSGTTSDIAGSNGYAGSFDGVAAEARFSGPTGITACNGNLYIVDTSNFTVRKLGISTGQVETIAGKSCQQGSSNGKGAAALFSIPTAITCDGSSLYVTDAANDNIRMIPIK